MGNRPELTCRALATWAEGLVDLAFIPPGEPWKDVYVGWLDSRQRDEFLNITTFLTLLHARVEISEWHRKSTTVQRHFSLDYKTLTEYADYHTSSILDWLPIRPDRKTEASLRAQTG